MAVRFWKKMQFGGDFFILSQEILAQIRQICVTKVIFLSTNNGRFLLFQILADCRIANACLSENVVLGIQSLTILSCFCKALMNQKKH